MSNKGKTHKLKRLTPRQAAIRSAFVCAYPSSVSLVELFASSRRDFDILTALIKGRTYRAVAANYGISINALYDREVRFYKRAETYLVRNPKYVKMHPKTKEYAAAPYVAPILSLPTGKARVKHNN